MRSRKAFAEAPKKRRASFFIDELDSVGRAASVKTITAGSTSSSSPPGRARRGRAANRSVCGRATNHPDLIDPALFAARRLDRHFRILSRRSTISKTVLAHHLGKLDGLERAARACALVAAAVAQVAREAPARREGAAGRRR